MKEVGIKWVCDISKDKLNTAMNKYNILNGTTDYKRILEDGDVDAVIIATPPATHYRIANDAVPFLYYVVIAYLSCI